MTCVIHSIFFFFKQKTAYEMRISDWSSDVCSSDLPGYTSLIDPDFPAKFAAFAARAAERYPWIESWTPINEPLTTARFSALYGHWYPHRKDPISFSRALMNQCLGTLRGMRAIRAVRSEEHTSELQSLMRISYAVFC